MENLLPLIADVLLLAAAMGAAFYCMILSRRLARLNSVDKGLGGAIAVLSAQVDDLTKALSDAQRGSEATAERLASLVSEAETMANDIEEILAVSHDYNASPDTDVSKRRTREAEPADDFAPTTPVFRRRVVQEAAE